MAITITLLIATLLTAAVLTTALVPARAAVWLGSLTNVVQLHTFSLLGVYPSLALLAWLATWRSVLGSPLWRWKWMQAVLALMLVQALSLAWSPNVLLGVRHLIYVLPLPFAAHALYRITRDDPAFARKCVRLLLLGSALEATLVIAFRFLPSLEAAFLNGPATLFVSANTLQEVLYGAGNNVLDPEKSGGVFPNANVASAYLGASAIAAWYVGRVTRSSALRAVALLDWSAVLLTGSKAGLMCAVAIPLFLAALSALRARRANPVTLFVGSVGLALGTLALALPIAQAALEEYGRNTMLTLGSRQELWSYAQTLVEQNAFRGLGFGGWEQRFQALSAITGATAMPAHNSLFILWLQSGLPGLVAGLVFIGALYATVSRTLHSHDLELHQLSMAAAGAFTWQFVQGLGENFGLIGEVHLTPLIAALLGHLCARYDTLEHYEHSTESLRGAVAPSAIPAV